MGNLVVWKISFLKDAVSQKGANGHCWAFIPTPHPYPINLPSMVISILKCAVLIIFKVKFSRPYKRA